MVHLLLRVHQVHLVYQDVVVQALQVLLQAQVEQVVLLVQVVLQARVVLHLQVHLLVHLVPQEQVVHQVLQV